MKSLNHLSELCTTAARYLLRDSSRLFLCRGQNLHSMLLLGLVVTAHPLQAAGSFSGVYTGTFTGGSDNGEFALLVRPDNSARLLFYDAFDEEGGAVNLTIDGSGNFSFVSANSPFDTISGQIAGNSVNGTICCAEPGTIVGTRSSDSGPLQNAGGLYLGEITGSGVEDGTPVTFDGQAHLIIDAPGKTMFYAEVDVFINGVFQEVGETGGALLAAANGALNGTFLDGVTLNGAVNLGNFTAAGSWSYSDATASDSGTWNASRSEGLPALPDSDGDGVPDSEDAFPNNPNESVDTDGDGIGNNADTDDDGDGIPDVYENENNLDPLNAADANEDADGDGFTNLEEFQEGSDPQDASSIPGSNALSWLQLLLG